MGFSHALTGALAGVIAAQVFDSTWGAIAVGTVVTIGASLVPDLDCGSSTVSNTLGPLTRLLSWLIRNGTGGHRRGTHSIAGAAALALLAHVAVDHRAELWSKVVLGVVLFLCIAGPVRLMKIRGILDDLIPIPIAFVMVTWDAVPLELVPASLFIGFMVHILGDMITKMGCPVFWPVDSKSYALAKLKAGGWTEVNILRPAFIVAIPIALCWTWLDPYWVELLNYLAEYLDSQARA